MKKILVLLLVCAFVFTMSGNALFAKSKPKTVKLGFMSSMTGPFAAVGKTQKEAFTLAVEQKNKEGGLSMPWGKVKIEGVYADDEAKIDVGVKRFREMADQGIKGLVGQCFNPMTNALNEECKITPVVYLPGCLPALKSFKKGNMADCTFCFYTPWTVGYLAGKAVITKLNKKTIYYINRSDLYGNTVYEGLKVACKQFGGKIIGFDEFALGHQDFTVALNNAKRAKPDVLMAAQFGGDAIALFKQAYDLGLYDVTIPFNAYTAMVVAKALPPKALEGFYALTYFYWNLTGLSDKEAVAKAGKYSEAYYKRWNEYPDSLATIAYNAMEIMMWAFEKAGSFDPKKVSEVLKNAQKINTVKGTGKYRVDRQMSSSSYAYFVKGKSPGEMKNKWDIFKVLDSYGGDDALPPLKQLGW